MKILRLRYLALSLVLKHLSHLLAVLQFMFQLTFQLLILRYQSTCHIAMSDLLSCYHRSHQESAIFFRSRTKSRYDCLNCLLAFESLVGLVADITRGGGGRAATLEEAGEDWLEDRSEDDLGTVGDGKGHPQDQDELEDVVEC